MLIEPIARMAARAQVAAMCLDFDGTLAPIVDDPNEARPLPGTVELLGRLAARFAAVVQPSWPLSRISAVAPQYVTVAPTWRTSSVALPFIRGGSPTLVAGRRPSLKQLGKSPNVTDWTSYSASWSGSCAQRCAATRVKLFGGSSTSPTPAAWSWSSLIGRRDCRSSFGDYSPERCTRCFNELVVQPTFSLRTALAPSVP
jgi:hypothetical protein